MMRPLFPPLLALALALAACSHHPAPQPAAAADTRLVEIPIPLPPPIPLNPDIPIPPGVEIPTTHPTIIAPRNAVNLALHRPVTSSDPNPELGRLDMLTDGDKGSGQSSIVEIAPGPQWIRIDLGRPCDIYGIAIWRDYAAHRIYDATIVELSDDPNFINDLHFVYNNDTKNSWGMGYGKERRYVEGYQGKVIPPSGHTARYVQLYTVSGDRVNRLVEIEVYGVPATPPIHPIERSDEFREAYQKYMATEGPQRRGQSFFGLAFALDYYSRGMAPVPKSIVLKYLGPPDLVYKEGQEEIYDYFWDRLGKKDWAVLIYLRDDAVSIIGYNATRANEYKGSHPYRPRD